MNKKCLNCETELLGSFCHHCGQKSSTHRITFAKFIQHDLLHGVLHLDKGILFTIKSLFTSPGYTAINFLLGKRVLHYNIFALFIIIVSLKTVIELQIEPSGIFESKNAKETDTIVNSSIKNYYKLIFLLYVPLFSIFSSWLFKKLSFNFIEHTVLNCFFFTGVFFIAFLTKIAEYFSGIDFDALWFILGIAYFLVSYYQATKGIYNFADYLWRTLLACTLFLATLLGILFLIIIIFYNGTFNGQISI